jgi:hypothetical protein
VIVALSRQGSSCINLPLTLRILQQVQRDVHREAYIHSLDVVNAPRIEDTHSYEKGRHSSLLRARLSCF